MMAEIGEALAQVVQLLKSTGIKSVSADAASLNLPGALVTPDSIVYDRIGGEEYTVVWNVYLVAGDHGPVQSLNTLGHLLELVRPLGVGTVETISMTLPDHASAALPALHFTISTNVS